MYEIVEPKSVLIKIPQIRVSGGYVRLIGNKTHFSIKPTKCIIHSTKV